MVFCMIRIDLVGFARICLDHPRFAFGLKKVLALLGFIRLYSSRSAVGRGVPPHRSHNRLESSSLALTRLKRELPRHRGARASRPPLSASPDSFPPSSDTFDFGLNWSDLVGFGRRG